MNRDETCVCVLFVLILIYSRTGLGSVRFRAIRTLLPLRLQLRARQV
jgi:hypothetical protein